MKVILSRKGFDSSFGGHPSIIIDRNKLIPLSIPGDEDEILYDKIKSCYGNCTYGDILRKAYRRIHYYKWINTSEMMHCHFDPDIQQDALVRVHGWRGCFGQGDAAQTVLAHNNVGKGDLFLFFGWFADCQINNHEWHVEEKTGKHLIYGYMEIEKVLYTSADKIPKWLAYHPHALQRRLFKKNNCIYIASEFLSWNKQIPGYGLFNYDDSLKLTKDGMSRSKWDLPYIFKNIKMTYHSELSWKGNYFQSAMRGQEFVIEENPMITKWAMDLVSTNYFRSLKNI